MVKPVVFGPPLGLPLSKQENGDGNLSQPILASLPPSPCLPELDSLPAVD